MTFTPLSHIASGAGASSSTYANLVIDDLNALNRDPLKLPPFALTNSFGTLNSYSGDLPAALVGDASHDCGSKHGDRFPSDMKSSSGVVSLTAYVLSTTGGNYRYSVTATQWVPGSGTGSALPGIAATNAVVVANQWTPIDFSAAIVGYVPGNLFGLTWNHLGTVDGFAVVYHHGIYLVTQQ